MTLFAQQSPDGTWKYPVGDGLGSIRGVTDAAGDSLESRMYSPYGEVINQTGTTQTPFGFTGEPTDQNGLVYLRSRYYNPFLGMFPELDMYEGMISDLLSLNRYSYVKGNPVNLVDPSGMVDERPERWDSCNQTDPCAPTGLPTNTPRSQGLATNTPRGNPTSTPCPPNNNTSTPQATNASGTPCRYANGTFFNVFGLGIDNRPVLLGGNYITAEMATATPTEQRRIHQAVDIVPVGIFPAGDNQLSNERWAGPNSPLAVIYAAVNGILSGYADGGYTDMLLENNAEQGWYFQYVHVTPDSAFSNIANNYVPVCAGDRIGVVSTGDNRESSTTDHLHFAYRNSRAGNATYRDPRPFFNPSILMSRSDVINYRTATLTANPATATPQP